MSSELRLNENDITEALDEIAAEIARAYPNDNDLVLIGIETRGVPLAYRIKKRLDDLNRPDVRVGSLDVTLFRDDLKQQNYVDIKQSKIPCALNHKHVIFVDDVIDKGRTIAAALQGINDYGRPSSIDVAVLVDRPHRELPIHARFVGTTLEASTSSRIMVNLFELDGIDQVLDIDESEAK